MKCIRMIFKGLYDKIFMISNKNGDEGMKLIYEIDFSALSAEEKVVFMHDLRDSMKTSTT